MKLVITKSRECLNLETIRRANMESGTLTVEYDTGTHRYTGETAKYFWLQICRNGNGRDFRLGAF